MTNSTLLEAGYTGPLPEDVATFDGGYVLRRLGSAYWVTNKEGKSLTGPCHSPLGLLMVAKVTTPFAVYEFVRDYLLTHTKGNLIDFS